MKLSCHTKDLPNCVLLISSHCGPPGSAGKRGGESGMSRWFQGLDKASGNLSMSPQKWSPTLSRLFRVVSRAWSFWVLGRLCEGRFGPLYLHSPTPRLCAGWWKNSASGRSVYPQREKFKAIPSNEKELINFLCMNSFKEVLKIYPQRLQPRQHYYFPLKYASRDYMNQTPQWACGINLLSNWLILTSLWILPSQVFSWCRSIFLEGI